MSILPSNSRTLHRLIYCSRQAFSAEQDADFEIEAIAASSTRNNKLRQLSGLLLVHEGWFVQALEGPAEQVISTYQFILEDKRHRKCRVMSAGPASERLFPEWTMCARRFSSVNDAVLDVLGRRASFSPDTLNGHLLVRVLEAVREPEHRIALRA